MVVEENRGAAEQSRCGRSSSSVFDCGGQLQSRIYTHTHTHTAHHMYTQFQLVPDLAER